jgi:signal transduction histidine kinase
VTRRLTGVFLALVGTVLVLVAVPLAGGWASTQTSSLLLDRTADTARLARLAAPALARDAVDVLEPELRAYTGLYGVTVEVYDRDGVLLLTGSGDRSGRAPADALERALAGRRWASSPAVRPWGPRSVAVAEPVLRGTEVAGAVVTVSPTGRLRADVLTAWVLLLLGSLAVLVVAAVVTVPLSRWILRPVRRLDDAVHTLTDGDLTAHVDTHDGPPELRRLLSSFNAMAAALRTSMTQQRALVADASHQLRNPLAALRLRVDALEDAVAPQSRQDHRLAVEELERLTRVLDDTLALARAQDGDDDHSAVDVLDCVLGRLQVWSSTAVHDDTVLLLEDEGSGWVLTPPGALPQVLDALLHNALRFARGGTVTVRVSASGPDVEVRVRDDGPGLTAEQCALATRRFWRGPDQQNVPGSGLGLSIAATLVERCDGELQATPAVPTGLDVRVRLPRVPVELAQPSSSSTPGLAAR